MRDREIVQRRGRETETESEASPRLQAVSIEPDVGLKLISSEIMT